jgi:hypothetical protein
VSSQIVATIAGAALVLGGFAAGAGTRSAAALPERVGLAASGAAEAAQSLPAGRCQVEVLRSGAAGSSDVRRRQLDNGDCVCTITTGPSPVNGAAEDIVRALLRDRECTNVLAPADLGNVTGGMGGVVMPVVFGVGAIGLGAALAGSSKG